MNLQKSIDVVGVGNAIVDIIARSDDKFIKKYELIKGSMSLADKVQSEKILGAIEPVLKTSGGSAANTIFGLSQLGCKTAFIGKRSDDAIGKFFKADLESSNIVFNTSPMINGASSGMCMILVTPDAERTMVTFLGSSKELSEKDIDETIVSLSKIVYLEGYLFDPPKAQKAFKRVSNFAHNYGSLVAFTLSDSFCVDRHREKMKEFISKDVNILLCNEGELVSLYNQDSMQSCIDLVRSDVTIAAVTLGKKGAVIIDKNSIYEISAFPASVVDTTGAGDLFASGFLAGLSKNLNSKQSGILGSACSAEIISHFGARPAESLDKFIKKFNLNI